MKLYKIISPEYAGDEGDEIQPKRTAWEGTQADARKTRIQFEEPFKHIKPAKRPRVEVEEVDVPTNKTELLAWLNANAV